MSKSKRSGNHEGKCNMADYFELPNPNLSAYLQSVEAGQPLEYRTTFYKKETVSDVLKRWMVNLDVLEQRWPTLYHFEVDLAKKVGPLSVMKPLVERMDDIDAYYDSISLGSKPIDNDAILSALREWGQNSKLSLRSEDLTVHLMKKSTNSGSPYFTKRKWVVDRTVPVDLTQTSQMIGPDEEKYGLAAILGWRGQEGGPEKTDVKQRVVWMFPFAVNIQELQCYQPLIELFQRHSLVPAWVSMDAVDTSITRMFDTKDPNDVVVCTDFTKFDQHFNSSLQKAAGKCIAAILVNDESSMSWLEVVFPIKFEIPLCYGWNKIRYGLHGMGSGSGGTNVDETLVHRVLQHEAALLQGKELNLYSQCLGDDGVLTFPGCTVDNIVQTYSRHGLPMNPDKQYVSTEDCVYLRRWHHKDYRINGVCVGVYSTCRALGRLLEQERRYKPEIWSTTMVALRQLSILENVKWHPLRERFVEFCIKGDKYRLGVDIPGFLDNIEVYAQEAIDQIPDFLGYTNTMASGGKNWNPDGITKWWIVQYLKSLS